LSKGQRAAGKFRVEEWLGISTDEATRAKPSRISWIETRWPLLYDVQMSRSDCLSWLSARGFPVPKKSACTFCPFRKPIEYSRWREEEPELFEAAAAVDRAIRVDGAVSRKGMKKPQYVSNLLVPLDEIPTTEELSKQPGANQDLFDNECEGMCGL
jgi:hypothetical protein